MGHMTDAQTLKDQYVGEIMSDSNVSSVGIGLDDDGNEVLVIGVKVKTQAISLPDALSDDDYEIQEVGEIVPEVVGAQVVAPQDRQGPNQPVPGGVSAGHVDITAGTTGWLLTDGSTVYTASNNHVYADINQGSQGDTIIQPGSADGGVAPEDQSATLEDYVTIENGVTVDLAWAVQEVEHTNELLGIGTPSGEARRVEVGDVLVKSGRTTAVTEGQVQQVNATVDVNFGDAGVITLEDQIMASDMSEPGDSGSAAIIKGEGVPGAHLFAGSSTITVLNQAVNVESESGLSIVTGSGTDNPTANVELQLVRESPDEGNIQATVVAVDESGTVLGPIEGATVTISGEVQQSGQTDANGEVVFSGVPIGSYTISASADGHADDSASVGSGDFQ